MKYARDAFRFRKQPEISVVQQLILADPYCRHTVCHPHPPRSWRVCLATDEDQYPVRSTYMP